MAEIRFLIKLKDRLKLVESEIRAGNNNPVLKSELKILYKNKLHSIAE